MAAVLTLPILLLVVLGVGLIVTRESLAWACVAGFAILGHALFALAALGVLNRTAILVLVGVLVIAGIARGGWVWPRLHWSALALIPPFVLALCPPVEFDETLYHLPYIRALAESGVLAFYADIRFPVFPILQELLSVPVFLFAGDTATHLVALAEGIATVALLLDWGRHRGTPAGVLAAAAFAGGPVIIHLATSGYVEAGITLFVTAGCYCLDRQRFLAAGLFFGTACGVKYLGWYFAGMAGLMVLAAAKPRWKNAAIYLAGFLAAALPTYLWIFLESGDPLFPFLRPSPWTPIQQNPSMAERAIALVRIPWDVTLARHRIGFQPHFTPLFAAALAMVAFGAVRDLRVRAVAILTAVYLVIFVFLPPDSRYLVPLLPVLLFAAATTLRVRASLVPWIVALALLPGPAYAIHRLARYGLPPFSHEGRIEYLDRRLPEYPALRLAGTARVFGCGVERLKYFAEGPFYAEVYGPLTLERVRPEMVLASKRVCPSFTPGPGFTLSYEDEGARLWRRVESAR